MVWRSHAQNRYAIQCMAKFARHTITDDRYVAKILEYCQWMERVSDMDCMDRLMHLGYDNKATFLFRFAERDNNRNHMLVLDVYSCNESIVQR